MNREFESEEIQNFLNHYEDHFNILICENFDNMKYSVRQETVFNEKKEEVLKRFIQEHTELVNKNSKIHLEDLPRQPRPAVVKFTTICDGCHGCVVYNTVSCGDQCALLIMLERIANYN